MDYLLYISTNIWVPNAGPNMLFNIVHTKKLKKGEKRLKIDANFSQKMGVLNLYQLAGQRIVNLGSTQQLKVIFDLYLGSVCVSVTLLLIGHVQIGFSQVYHTSNCRFGHI